MINASVKVEVSEVEEILSIDLIFTIKKEKCFFTSTLH